MGAGPSFGPGRDARLCVTRTGIHAASSPSLSSAAGQACTGNPGEHFGLGSDRGDVGQAISPQRECRRDVDQHLRGSDAKSLSQRRTDPLPRTCVRQEQ
jgi:hypothetical protein